MIRLEYVIQVPRCDKEKYPVLRAKIGQDVDKLLTFKYFFWPCWAWFSAILYIHQSLLNVLI